MIGGVVSHQYTFCNFAARYQLIRGPGFGPLLEQNSKVLTGVLTNLVWTVLEKFAPIGIRMNKMQ